MTDKEIWKQVMAKYPRTEKEKEGCLSEMQRMYDLRKAYQYELEAQNISKDNLKINDIL